MYIAKREREIEIPKNGANTNEKNLWTGTNMASCIV